MKLNLGCGKDLLPGYINIDIDSNLELVRVGDVRDLSDFDDGSMEVVRATDIIEHFELDEVGNILTEWIRVLEPGGSLYIRCPDIVAIVTCFYPEARAGGMEWSKLSEMIHGHCDKYNRHRVTFAFEWLKKLLDERGMIHIKHAGCSNQNMIVTALKRENAP